LAGEWKLGIGSRGDRETTTRGPRKKKKKSPAITRHQLKVTNRDNAEKSKENYQENCQEEGQYYRFT